MKKLVRYTFSLMDRRARLDDGYRIGDGASSTNPFNQRHFIRARLIQTDGRVVEVHKARLLRSFPISIIEIAVPRDMWHEREAGLAGAMHG